MDNSRPYLVIGTPCYGGMATNLYTLSLLKLQRACDAAGIGIDVFMISGDALITRARNNIVTHFLSAPEGTHLMFIDSDIGFEPEEVLRLIEFDVDVAGGLYPVKRLDWNQIGRVARETPEQLPQAALNYVIGFDNPDSIVNRGGFAKARHIGNGFMLIKRHVFEAMKQRYPELRFRRHTIIPDPQEDNPNRYGFFDSMITTDGTYLPEDYAFCQRWTGLGGEIWVDLRSKLTHLGQYAFPGDASAVFRPIAPKS